MDPRPVPGAGELQTSASAGPAGGEWAGLLARYRPIAVRLAQGIVRRIDLAEDVVQESARAVLERAASGGASFESPDHARNYFLRTVHNRAVNALREGSLRHGREREGVEELESPSAHAGSPLDVEGDAERALLIERVTRALAGLRSKDREAVELRYLAGLSYREISERTGASISTLHSRVEAALGRIRARIGKEGRRP